MKPLRKKKARYVLIPFLMVSLTFFACSVSKQAFGIASQSGSSVQVNPDSLGIVQGVFDIPELKVEPSPDSKAEYIFSTAEKVVDYDVSPVRASVAVITKNSADNYLVKFWTIGATQLSDSLQLPDGLKAKAIAWHPNAKVVFVMGEKGGIYQIMKLEKSNKSWDIRFIYSTPNPLRRLVVGPRPFIIESDSKIEKDYYSYRLFFGMDNGDKTFRTVSVTESGNRFYQVIGPSKTASKFKDAGSPPSAMVSDWALPIAFHPAGHQLIWEGKSNNFFVANYQSRAWGESKPMEITIQGGTITPTPNGLGLLHWKKDLHGIGVYLISSKKEEMQLSDYQFTSTPSSVPDGKGIVGMTLTNDRYSLSYLPVKMPLADVVNAWMFSTTNEEINLFQKHSGLFRPNSDDQMYKLYETENYYCNSYDRNAPTRPYLVTTDIFWELFGAAYQGLFIVRERDEAIPNFWKFVAEAEKQVKKTGQNPEWAPVFTTLMDIRTGRTQNPEVGRIIAAKDGFSELIHEDYSYSDLKPRGHYTSTPEMENYFRAFRYFSTIYKSKPLVLNELNQLPDEITTYALRWMDSYSGFISPSRSQLVWKNQKTSIPAYCNYPGKDPVIFPLSWGFDNETLYSTVFHPDSPPQFRVTGPNGPRLLPSGLDLAAALGNGLAAKLLESDFEKYPPLRAVIQNLQGNFSANGKKEENNLYNQWINAVAVQWADDPGSANGAKNLPIWQSKRLQTGLATWATLRHATILVNERTAAECGESGFEELLMRAPRGAVEPDPDAFGAIAGLFESAIRVIPKGTSKLPDIQESSDDEKRSLYEGIVVRLKDAAKDARAFQKMAEKERSGGTLTNEEYEKILYVARTAEHLFLIFNSLSNKDYALSNPDPMAKIADVAGGSEGSGTKYYLMSAVGNSMEWNYIVPFYGRHQIVKGAVYSYYEFVSEKLLTDQEWRKKVLTHELLPWIKPYVATPKVIGMASTSY